MLLSEEPLKLSLLIDLFVLCILIQSNINPILFHSSFLHLQKKESVENQYRSVTFLVNSFVFVDFYAHKGWCKCQGILCMVIAG